MQRRTRYSVDGDPTMLARDLRLSFIPASRTSSSSSRSSTEWVIVGEVRCGGGACRRRVIEHSWRRTSERANSHSRFTHAAVFLGRDTLTAYCEPRRGTFRSPANRRRNGTFNQQGTKVCAENYNK